MALYSHPQYPKETSMHPTEAIIRQKWNTLNEEEHSIRVINDVAYCYTGKTKAGYVYTRPSQRMVQFAWINKLSDNIDVPSDTVISSGVIPWCDFLRFNEDLDIT